MYNNRYPSLDPNMQIEEAEEDEKSSDEDSSIDDT